MSQVKPLLIIFIKNPEKGKVKTRLAKEIGDDRALEIYKQLLDHTNSITSVLEVEKCVYYSNYVDQSDMWNLGQFQKRVQQGNDLGTKMLNAFHDGFENSNGPICIIGSDCFEIDESIINEAFNKLNDHDFVIGPAKDGGYYLLGMRTFVPQIFADKTYSTSNVCKEAIEEIERLNRNYFLLPKLSDIDTIDDLNL